MLVSTLESFKRIFLNNLFPKWYSSFIKSELYFRITESNIKRCVQKRLKWSYLVEESKSNNSKKDGAADLEFFSGIPFWFDLFRSRCCRDSLTFSEQRAGARCVSYFLHFTLNWFSHDFVGTALEIGGEWLGAARPEFLKNRGLHLSTRVVPSFAAKSLFNDR